MCKGIFQIGQLDQVARKDKNWDKSLLHYNNAGTKNLKYLVFVISDNLLYDPI